MSLLPTTAAGLQPGPSVPSGPAHDRYDVVVVGARAAGAAVAMLLARRGLSVLAVDRAAAGSDTLSTHSLGRAALLQLHRWGVLDAIRSAGTPVTRTVVFDYGDEPTVLSVWAPGEPVDGLYSPRRTVLDPALVAAAVGSGAEVRHGCAVSGPTFDDSGRIDGVLLAGPDGPQRIAARWVVGADGARSGLARRVGAPLTHRETAAAAFVFGYWSGLPDDSIVNLYDRLGRGVGIIPTNDGQACVWIAMTPQRFETDARGDVAGAYLRAIADHDRLAARLAGGSLASRVRGFAGLTGFRRRPYGDGWALVGDAGCFKDPVSAHGITDAFIAAELLADALGDILQRGIDARTALAAYERDRDRLARELMPPVARIATLALDPPGTRAAFKELTRALANELAFLQARSLAGV